MNGTPAWAMPPEPVLAAPPPSAWPRLVARGLLLVLVVFAGLAILLFLRLFERPLCGAARPVTPYVTQCVCRLAFVIFGMRHVTHGRLMAGPGAVVANHSSWLDILALNARKRVYFVSKAEVSAWPVIGWLARATGTVFIRRDGRDAARQKETFEARLRAGHKLLFFPEGTSTDGLQIIPFKSSLFAAFFNDDLRASLSIQPVSVIYHAPPGCDARFYGWWGDMPFFPHLLQILAARRNGGVEIVYHPPLAIADHADRKALAAICEAAVRHGHETSLDPAARAARLVRPSAPAAPTGSA